MVGHHPPVFVGHFSGHPLSWSNYVHLLKICFCIFPSWRSRESIPIGYILIFYWGRKRKWMTGKSTRQSASLPAKFSLGSAPPSTSRQTSIGRTSAPWQSCGPAQAAEGGGGCCWTRRGSAEMWNQGPPPKICYLYLVAPAIRFLSFLVVFRWFSVSCRGWTKVELKPNKYEGICRRSNPPGQ